MLWLLLAVPLAPQIGGFSGADDDRDGLPDGLEQAVLEKFRPWMIGSSDSQGLASVLLVQRDPRTFV
jgi:hypothetical protein